MGQSEGASVYVVYSARAVCNTVHAPADWRLGGVGGGGGEGSKVGGQSAATDPMRRWVSRCP